jgi:hypothetical protein
VIVTRNDANEKLYGERFTAKQLLNGTVPQPREADSLYRALNAKFRNLGNTGAMYQRTIQQDESKTALYRNTTMSKPGTLRIPAVRQITGGYGAPNLALPAPPPPTSQVANPALQIAYPSLHQTAQQPLSPIPQQYRSPPHTKDHHEEKVQHQPNYPPQAAMASPAYTNASAPPPMYAGQRLSFSRDIKTSMPPISPSQNSKPMKAKALYAFTGDQEGDLSFEAGDIIYVTEKTDSQNDWWTGRLKGQLGSVSKALVDARRTNALFF